MSATIRTQITARLAAMLGAMDLQTARTEIARDPVLIGYRAANANEAPRIILIPGQERAIKEYGNSIAEIEYLVDAFVDRRRTSYAGYATNPHAEWAVIDAMLADVREAIEGTDAALAALIERINYEGAIPQPHEEGGDICGIKARYTVQYRIAKGDPDSLPN